MNFHRLFCWKTFLSLFFINLCYIYVNKRRKILEKRRSMKWYAGGQERKKVAMKLLIELYQSTEDPILKEFFAKYIRELDWGTSIPFALSAMNIEMASVLLKNKILLTKEQEEKVEELRKMSNIRYGYPN